MTPIPIRSNAISFNCSYNRNASEESNDVSLATSMVVFEVTLPTGYVADTSIFERLKSANPLIKKVELKNGDTVVVIYFDYLEANRTVCPVVDGFRVQKVQRQKPVSIVVYDYYESGEYDWEKCFYFLARN